MRLSIVPLILIFYNIFEEANTLLWISNTDIIDLPQGRIKGSFDWFKSQRKFLGIPYASVTGRFEESGSPPSWNGTYNADRGNIRCIQFFPALHKTVGQEDCLVLNIYTPLTLDQSPYPVMVFIHGGGFYWGSNSELIYNPKYLVQEKVIVVTINYRLGAFGFLCLGLKEAPGNVGLKDQLAALKWIQNNIAYFGGDPSSVTLFGESAGAVSVHHFLLSDSAKGLFHKAIIESGTVLMPQAFSYEPIKTASKVAFNLGYTSSDPYELLKIFRNSSAYDIIQASNIDQKNNVFAPYLFTPCRETEITNGRPLITEEPKDLLKKMYGLNIPVIIGFNNREGIYWAQHYDLQTLENLIDRIDTIIPSYLLFEKADDKGSFVSDIIKIYFSNTTITNGLIEYFTDSVVEYPATVTTKNCMKTSIKKVYNYYFEYDSFRNLNKFLTRLRTTSGACHGDELFYLFDPVVYSVLPPTPNDAAMIQTLTTLWTSFAKTGEPLNSKTTWRNSGEQLKFLELNKEIRMISLPNVDRMEFWRKTFERYGRR